MDMDQKPYHINAISNQIAIQWHHQHGSFDNYIIKYRELHGKNLTFRLMETLENEITLKNLKSNTSYEVRVYIQKEGEDELVFKDTTDTSTSPASQFKMMSAIVKDKPFVYQLRPVSVDKIAEDINEIHMVSDIEEVDKENMKTILFVGASESGKSTLLDALINYVLNVPYADEFRFKMIDDTSDQKKKVKNQVVSRTQFTTCYTIPQKSDFPIEFSLQVIDTPGLQDRNSSQTNKEISKQLMTLFGSEKVAHINAVCIVLPSSCRLTQEQQDVFKEILFLFGNDINCLIPLVTFDDGGNLNALSTLSEAGIPFMHHMHFRFNNAMLFSENESEDAWNNRNESFKNLLASISVNTKQSVKLTEEVLKLRTGIHSDLKFLKRKKGDLESMRRNISQCENEVNYHEQIRVENEDFQYKEDEVVDTKKESSNGLYINCPSCKSKCKTIRETSSCSCSSCCQSFWWGLIQICSFLWSCSVLRCVFRCICIICCFQERNCLRCNRCNCMLGDHVKESALYRKVYQNVIKIHNTKKAQHDSATEAKENLQKKIQNLKKELNTLVSQFEDLIDRNMERVHTLNNIALKSEQYNEIKEMADAVQKVKGYAKQNIF